MRFMDAVVEVFIGCFGATAGAVETIGFGDIRPPPGRRFGGKFEED